MTYQVNEYFVSVQGEGPSVGQLSVFIRFSGCNVKCAFCDTDHKAVNFEFEDAFDLLDRAVPATLRHRGLSVILTGGEPLLQIDDKLVQAAKHRGFRLCLETNGTKDAASRCLLSDVYRTLTVDFDEVSVSPKGPMECIDTEVVRSSSCLKLIFPGQFTENSIYVLGTQAGNRRGGAQQLVFQPMTVPDVKVVQEYYNRAVSVAVQFWNSYGQRWRIIPQTHVLMDIK